MQLRSVATVAIGADRTRPDIAIRSQWPTHDVAAKAGDLGGVYTPINDQLSRASHGR
jgi:hypothetical protein